MTIYFYKRLPRNPEIGNTPAQMFGTDVPNKMSLIKCYQLLQNARVTVFKLLKKNEQGGVEPTKHRLSNRRVSNRRVTVFIWSVLANFELNFTYFGSQAYSQGKSTVK